MARVQTRRAVSLNREVFDAINKAAASDGKSVARFITDLARAAIADIPDTVHFGPTPIRERAVRVAKAAQLECDCGNPKSAKSEACERCIYLDGDGYERIPLAVIISMLRGTDGMSLRELCIARGMNTEKNNGQKVMRRYVALLIEQGRVRRYWRESDSEAYSDIAYFGSADNASRRAGGTGCWVYALDGATEQEWSAA